LAVGFEHTTLFIFSGPWTQDHLEGVEAAGSAEAKAESYRRTPMSTELVASIVIGNGPSLRHSSSGPMVFIMPNGGCWRTSTVTRLAIGFSTVPLLAAQRTVRILLPFSAKELPPVRNVVPIAVLRTVAGRRARHRGHLTPGEAERLLKAARDNRYSCRDHALLLVMVSRFARF
jgi:hypothetical protein